MTNHLGQHAVVIGGSLAGLMAARVLADHFDQVTVLERDHIDGQPAVHKSIPQGHHIHGLLLGGQQVLSSLYPDFIDKLAKLGAVRCRIGKEQVFYLPDGKAYSFTGTVREPRDLGFDFYCQSRGLLEHCVRQGTLALTNVRSESSCTVQGLSYKHARVHGVHYTSASSGATSLAADLVVDAGGRGSHVPRWLTALGFPTPEETTIGVDIAYASTKFRVPPYYDERERILAFVPSPQYPNGAGMLEIEEQTWHLSLVGRFGEYPPTDEEGFLAFAKSMHTPKLYNLI